MFTVVAARGVGDVAMVIVNDAAGLRGIAVPGTAPGAQPARAGERWRARPNRPSSGHRSADPNPQPVIAAYAAAATALNASPSGKAADSGSAGSAPEIGSR